ELEEWIPLMMKEREMDEPVAATKVDAGTDVNFGALTTKLLTYLESQHANINYHHDVEDIQRRDDGSWEVKVRNNRDGAIEYHTAKHVFIGAGGGALPLLQKTN